MSKVKFFVLLISIAAISPFAKAQWSSTAGGIYYSAGKVGIGTSPSVNQLHIYGSNSQNLLKVENSRSSDAGIEFKSALANFKVGAGIGSGTNSFRIYDLNAGATRFVIDGNGNIGVGVTETSNKMSINSYRDDKTMELDFGTVNAGMFSEVSGYYTDSKYAVVGIAHNYSAAEGSAVGVYGSAPDHGGKRQWAGYFNGNAKVTGSFNHISDIRFKENIKAIDKSLEKILKIEPKEYFFKKVDGINLPSGKSFGLIAQELSEIFPELVSASPIPDPGNALDLSYKDRDYLSVDYIGLIPHLIKSIQEQQMMLDQVKNQLLLNDNNTATLAHDAIKTVPYIINISPNPSNEETHISCYLPDDLNNAEIQIIDHFGSLVTSKTVHSDGKVSIAIIGIKPGVHLVALVVNQVTYDIKRLIISN